MYACTVALVALGIFVGFQVSAATAFGVSNGRTIRAERTSEARNFANFRPSCSTTLSGVIAEPESTLRDAVEDQLGEYGPTSYRYYRELGPTPTIIAGARRHGITHCFLLPNH